jgi:hypothetical protein
MLPTEIYLRAATIIQSSSESLYVSSVTSSTSGSISRVLLSTVRLFFAFFFATSASAFSTTSRISCVLKTNLPLIVTRFPVLRSLRTRKSALASTFSCCKSMFLECVLSKAALAREIYRFAGDAIFDSFTTLLIKDVACRSPVPVGGELSRSVKSRSLVVSIGGGVVVRDREGIFSVERIVIGGIRYILVARNDDRMLLAIKAFSRALMKAVVHSTRGIRRVSKRKRGSNS